MKANNKLSYMKYYIVAGEEMVKLMKESLPDAIPFNEDMSVGAYHYDPFSEDFIVERSQAHHVNVSIYKQKLQSLLNLINNLHSNDEIHLYFGEDKTCITNREFLINFFMNKVELLVLHIVDELTCLEIKEPIRFNRSRRMKCPHCGKKDLA